MLMKRTIPWALALCAALAAPVFCQDDAPAEDAAEAPVADAPAQPAAAPAAPNAAAPAAKQGKKPKAAAKASPEDAQGLAVDKARFEAYLKERLAKIDEHQRMRTNFFAREKKDWEEFWAKIRKERRDFEFRITRQTLDLFDSLASLDAKDHPTTITNFEKLQTDFIRSFESTQKSKMSEFFGEREARWKEFASEQERERVAFTTDAETGWEAQKASIGVSVPSKKSKKKAKPVSSDEPAPGTVIRAHPEADASKSEAPSKSPLRKEKPASDAKDDVWH